VREFNFAHHKLDAFHVALEAMIACDAIAKRLPRGYGPLADQLRRSSQSAYLQLAEGANRIGADSKNRFRGGHGEAGEAAAAVEGIMRLSLVDETECMNALELLDRVAAMLTRLGR
jgi:four helix bundle protein